MKNTILIILLFLCCLNAIAQDNLERILITNITIISADSQNVHSSIGNVLFNNNKIEYVGNQKPVIKGGFTEIDGTEKFLIPGLIDSHVHLANTAGFNGQLKNKYPKLLEAYFEQLPKSYLYHGFTTLIDVNNYAPHVINKINQNQLYPNIYTCGNQVKVMDDFDMEMEEYSQEERYQSQFLYDKYNKQVIFPT